jgi:hypothetical protein
MPQFTEFMRPDGTKVIVNRDLAVSVYPDDERCTLLMALPLPSGSKAAGVTISIDASMEDVLNIFNS